MKRILILVAISLYLCSTASAFQGGGGESTRRGSSKKKATTTGSKSSKATKSATPATSSSLPKWMTQLSKNPILPGIGLAGIQIGYSERTVVRALGPTESTPVKTDKGEVLRYALIYSYSGVTLGIYTSPDTRKVFSIRLFDENFNSQAYIPRTDKGATIGMSAFQLQQILGEPLKKEEHGTCPQSLGNVHTTTVHYLGISFWVCDANGLVHLIDIP